MPAARLVMQEIPMTRMPIWRAAMASQAVLMPTASAPRVRHMAISCGDSYCGPGELQINAFHQVDIKAGCGFPCDFLEFKVVDLAHIRETGAELVDVRSDKRRWNEAGDLAV